MRILDRKEGYGHLIDWVIRVGDLLLINGIIILFYYLSDNNLIYGDEVTYQENIITLLLINLIYFITSFFVPIRLSFNVIQIEKVVQNSLHFAILFCTFLTCTLLLLGAMPSIAVQWILLLITLVLLYTLWHVIFRASLKIYRRQGYNFKAVVIIGSGETGVTVYDELKSSDYGYKIAGYYDDSVDEERKDALPPYLGTLSDFINTKGDDIDEIYCTLYNKDEATKALINLSEKNMIRFFFVPSFYRYAKRKLSLTMLDTIPILSIRREPLQYLSNRFIKRTFDIIFSLLVLCTIYPFIYILFGAIIKLTSPGKVFFSQERTGIKGKEFRCYKFRSMRDNKNANLESAIKGDPRVTRIGIFMRKTNIDELPQFINVLKGEMSIVGPRPHMLLHTDQYSALIDQFMVRHLVKPGITGWAQVTGMRGEIGTVKDMEQRVKKDVWYIENWSFFLDLKIIFLTVVNMIKGEEKAY